MPGIFDNISQFMLPALQADLKGARAADFCVGYFNLRGWSGLADAVEAFDGSDSGCCRVLVGMQRAPEDAMRAAQRAAPLPDVLDGPEKARRRLEAAKRFREQIEFGVPGAAAAHTLRQLAAQLRSGKVRLRLFLPYPLHAKLYLVHCDHHKAPLIGYVGSSNLTFSGLQHQGELNVDVLEQDAAQKLEAWFQERWDDPGALDISAELAELIETSWAGEQAPQPYHVYLRMAYHLSQDAREGKSATDLPRPFDKELPTYQKEAVALATQYLRRHGGALLGDVVGLGKTMMATAIAKVFEEDEDSSTLVICPPKLKSMWEWHLDKYELHGRVLSTGEVAKILPELRRYRLVIIDESHNLRNREGARYAAILEYLEDYRDSVRVLLLTATPYNKQFADLGNQLRLFLSEDRTLPVRPEKFIQAYTATGRSEADFMADHNKAPFNSLRAFERSEFADDWRDLMRLFLVRRTREFIMKNHAVWDDKKQRFWVELQGDRSYFPLRESHAAHFRLDDADPQDQYARLYRAEVVGVIEELALPRYGLTGYLVNNAEKIANASEKRLLENLNRAGRRLIGFCKTNLFKRLESSGHCFQLSVERHILRNMVTLHALENNLPLPLGTQDAALLDSAVSDGDDWAEETEAVTEGDTDDLPARLDLNAYRERAAAIYETYRRDYSKRFRWIDAKFFKPSLKNALQSDAAELLKILQGAGPWRAAGDAKLAALCDLLLQKHAHEKVLIFTQFADTALYLQRELARCGVQDLAAATTQSSDPTQLARRFSPHSNGGLQAGESEVRVLIATDVLSEGQNLQDSHVVVNYDLPWAIIRLIQRAGRVDRIGQRHDTIHLYSFEPAEGVEKIIRLRTRLSHRLEQNQEVIGTDESFFGEAAANRLRDFFAGGERARGVLSDDGAEDVDLASTALQVWNSAADADRKAAEKLPPLSYALRPQSAPVGPSPAGPPGAIVYMRYDNGYDALVRVNESGALVSQSLSALFGDAACSPDTPLFNEAVEAPGIGARTALHFDLVRGAVEHATRETSILGGQLGTQRSVSRRVFDRLDAYRRQLRERPTLFSRDEAEKLAAVLNALYRQPLREKARESLGRLLRLDIANEELAARCLQLHDDDRLCVALAVEDVAPEPQILCSLGLVNHADACDRIG